MYEGTPDGDEDEEGDIVMQEAANTFEADDVINDEDDKPPELSPEQLATLDAAAEEEEESRLIAMGVLEACARK